MSEGETTSSSQTGEGTVSVGVDEGHTSAASPGSGPYAIIRFIETLNGQAYNKLYIYPSVEINGDLDVSGNITQNGNPIGGSTASEESANDVQLLNGTLTFTNGVLTYFSRHSIS